MLLHFYFYSTFIYFFTFSYFHYTSSSLLHQFYVHMSMILQVHDTIFQVFYILQPSFSLSCHPSFSSSCHPSFSPLGHPSFSSLPPVGREGRVTRGREGRVARGREGRVTREREGRVKRERPFVNFISFVMIYHFIYQLFNSIFSYFYFMSN